jgi:hypothetical protein
VPVKETIDKQTLISSVFLSVIIISPKKPSGVGVF